ncbi:hypothetical protein AOQ84DRAFT_365181 [Glonium stellatum]|uniref:Nucleoporin Nup54 alpha-helical domain-containing protein n=1 Tax=Glonium stellatum TaxID=574774 RepID=A0A8E2JRU0_9PEZI|nr:hypothetical protein AOQ84DRAFT_365181 [Glonium stellatum]
MFGTQQQQAPKQFGTLFGSSTAPSGGLFASTNQPQQSGSLFGSTQAPQPQQGTSMFGPTLGVGSQQSNTGSFGSSQQNQGANLFKPAPAFSNPTQQQQHSSSIFGGNLMPAPSLGSVLGSSQQQLPQLRQSTLFKPFESASGPREKPIPEQMGILVDKWNPQSPNCDFQAYCYNQVPVDHVPFYGPGPHEDEKKWEEALAKKPSEGSIPVFVRGFQEVAQRLNTQAQAVVHLQNRLHEINDSLTAMMQNHDLVIAVRAAEAKRRHIAFTQRCLALATKVQILRNRGYAMDTAEEELKKKLIELEKKAFDPILGGRQEEIWARMSAVRARASLLQEESEKMGKNLENGDTESLDEEGMKKVKKVDGYDSQLSHLKQELDQIKTDHEEWEKASKPTNNGHTSGR